MHGWILYCVGVSWYILLLVGNADYFKTCAYYRTNLVHYAKNHIVREQNANPPSVTLIAFYRIFVCRFFAHVIARCGWVCLHFPITSRYNFSPMFVKQFGIRLHGYIYKNISSYKNPPKKICCIRFLEVTAPRFGHFWKMEMLKIVHIRPWRSNQSGSPTLKA